MRDPIYAQLRCQFRLGFCLPDFFQYPQNCPFRRADIQTHKPAPFRAKQGAGAHADTGFVDEEMFELRIGPIQCAAIQP